MVRIYSRERITRLWVILAFQAVLSIVRALVLYMHRPRATEPIITLAVEPYIPDHSILNTVIAVLMALVSFTLVIRVARHPATPIGLIVVIEVVLCLSLVGDVGMVGQSAYIGIPDIQKFVDVIIVVTAIRILMICAGRERTKVST